MWLPTTFLNKFFCVLKTQKSEFEGTIKKISYSKGVCAVHYQEKNLGKQNKKATLIEPEPGIFFLLNQPGQGLFPWKKVKKLSDEKLPVIFFANSSRGS